MNLSSVQIELDSALHAIKIGGPYREFALDRLCYALQLLVNELARLQAEHPELTSSDKPSLYSEQAFQDFTQLLAARCAEFSEKTGKEETK